MGIACKYCIAIKGLRLDRDRLFETEDELIEHIEMEHDMPVAREGETEEQTMRRFKAKNPRAGGPDCQCPACLHRRGDSRADIMALVDSLTKNALQ
jgi:hypothetical protein